MFSIDKYTPPGSVAAAFIRSRIYVPFLMGPVGSGKTNATIFRKLRYTAMMPPCRDGIIRAKGTVVRTDYRTLYKTTLASWHRWFPKDFPHGKFTGGADRPATHELRFATPRGRRIELTVEFAALGDNRIEEILRGWEGSWGWLNEADLLEEAALNFMYQRTSRWPPRAMLEGGVSLPPCVSGDLNPPGDPDHWIVKRFIDKVPAGDRDDPFATIEAVQMEGLGLFQQPSGLSPEAENVANLPDGYYARMMGILPGWDIQRFVHGKVGFSRSGKPVYPEFDPLRHVAPMLLKPVATIPLRLGFDGGLHPACTLSQDMPNGQWRVLEEIYGGRMGPGRFAELVAIALEARYRGVPIAQGDYDPSSDYGADKEGGEQSWVEIVQRALRIPMVPAPSNEIVLRTEAVRNLLTYFIDANTPGFWISPACRMLVKGFVSHYRYKLNPDGSLQNREHPRPDKNEYSNLHDSLQYPVLQARGRAGVVAAAAKGRMAGRLGAAGDGNKVLRSDFAC